SLIHAAAVADKDGNVIVLPGPGGVGKTALLGELVGRQNFRVLGDDIVGLSRSGECLAFPRSFALKEYHQSVYPEVFRRLGIGKKSDKKKSLQRFGLRLLWLLRENAPLVGISRSLMRGMGVRARPMQAVPPSPAHLQELGYLAAVPVEDIFGADKILTKGPIAKIIFLERYAGKQFRSETISHTSLAQRMFAIIHHEWVADMRRFFSLGALEILDLNNYFKTVNQIIRDAVADKPCNLMKIPENTTPDDLVKFFLDNFT
ncbi:MAG: hypothetical protein JW860_10740, partial [Sedimentisphaerales bacterium]|nr:hypothetical protein [Sedimentisphaerales bacterium]